MRTYTKVKFLKILRETLKKGAYKNKEISAELLLLSDIAGFTSLVGFSYKNSILLEYRGLRFLFIFGNAWNNPILKSQLKNRRKRDILYLLTLFLVLEKEILPPEEFKVIARYTLKSFKNSTLSLSFILNQLLEDLPIIERRVNIGLFPVSLDYLLNLVGALKKPSSLTRLHVLLLGCVKAVTGEFISNDYSEITARLEKCLRGQEKELKLLEDIKKKLEVNNPKFLPPKIIPQTIDFIINFKDGGRIDSITPTMKEVRVDLIIPTPDPLEPKHLPLLLIPIGCILAQKGLLEEEEKKELLRLIKNKTKIKDDYVLWNGVMEFRGTATPQGVIAFFSKKRVASLEGTSSNIDPSNLENSEQMFDSPEEENLIDFSDEEVTVPKKRIYKRKRTPENTPKSEYLEVWEVAEELEKEFPNRYKEKMFYTKWLYRQFNKGTISPVVLQQEIKLKEGVSYITKKYLVESRKLDEIKQVFRNWEEEKIIRGSRAVYVQLYAKTYGTTIREGQKMIKKHGAEEILRRLIKLKGLDEIIKNIGEILEKRKNKSIEDKIIEDLRRIFEKRRRDEDLEEEF